MAKRSRTRPAWTAEQVQQLKVACARMKAAEKGQPVFTTFSKPDWREGAELRQVEAQAKATGTTQALSAAAGSTNETNNGQTAADAKQGAAGGARIAGPSWLAQGSPFAPSGSDVHTVRPRK